MIPLDYSTLKVIWWILLGILLMGFAITEGFDFGVMLLMPFISEDDADRRVLINTVGPVWEGNQVWLILGGGAIFAAWPILYVVSFSGFYLAMILALAGLIFRPVAFKYRSKINTPKWRNTWDAILFISAFLPVLIFGVALGNVVQGVPFGFDREMHLFYQGTFLGLLNPYAILTGLLTLAAFVMQGAAFLQMKINNPMRDRAAAMGAKAAWLVAILYVLAGLSLLWIDGYQYVTATTGNGVANPLNKIVLKVPGYWLTNYFVNPFLLVFPIFTVVFTIMYTKVVRQRLRNAPMLCSSAVLIGLLLTFGTSLFPFLLPSASDPNMSLTIWDACSSHLTLFVMLIMVVIFMPIILAYTTWVYYVLQGPVTKASVKNDLNSY
jgi:cytochrome d ubiquinol oxidase subunit II